MLWIVPCWEFIEPQQTSGIDDRAAYLTICRLRTLGSEGCSGKGPILGETNREYDALTIGMSKHIESFAEGWKVGDKDEVARLGFRSKTFRQMEGRFLDIFEIRST